MQCTFNFTGDNYIVTGAASGMGRATAIELSRHGAKVALLDLDESGLDDTLSKMNGEGHLVICKDLCSDDYTDVFNTVVEKNGKINGVIHCAGIAPVIPASALSKAKLEKVMAINYYAFLELTRCIAKKKFRSEKCSIVCISSINSIYPEKCMTAYVASKAAINAAVQSLAIELSKAQIRINAVLPGIVDTPMTRKAFSEMNEDNLQIKQKKQVLGTTQPEEVVNVIEFLLSDLSSAITGRTIYADGGYLNI